ncbi:DedA family protein [Streptomyces corynorhini]|uniref:DedA family protein n=1 Tax=Streptomyces corynorhini TaxID=2282652 RepID=A0A370AMF8_9ACTN|nr:DedA family protein [Streptomyces corynorhini]RDG30541.1 DedA family protein [Streptomyces corynorhini]
MHTITNWLNGLSGPLIYAVVGALVFCEDALFFGFVLPGETAAILGGVLAGQGKVSLWWLTAVVVLAAVLGDSTGYALARHFGDRILTTRTLRRRQERTDRAREMIRERGAWAVFLARFVAFLRALMPALAGLSGMPYRRFLLFNALGGLSWGVSCTVLGYFAGAAFTRIESKVGVIAVAAVAAVVLVALAVWGLRRRRGEARRESERNEENEREAQREKGKRDEEGKREAESEEGKRNEEGKGEAEGEEGERDEERAEPEDPGDPR